MKTQKVPNKNIPCTHQYCHRHEIESEKPIGYPWASGLLTFIPGHGPNPNDIEAIDREKRRRQLIVKLFYAPLIEPVCPEIVKNLLLNEWQRYLVRDEMAHMFNACIQAGTDDVRKFIDDWKTDRSAKPRTRSTKTDLVEDKENETEDENDKREKESEEKEDFEGNS